MRHVILYDPITGDITGRVSASDPAQLENYPNRVDITSEEFEESPEFFERINPATKARVMLTEEEARAKGANEDQIERRFGRR